MINVPVNIFIKIIFLFNLYSPVVWHIILFLKFIINFILMKRNEKNQIYLKIIKIYLLILILLLVCIYKHVMISL